jgi:hypothetical protein
MGPRCHFSGNKAKDVKRQTFTIFQYSDEVINTFGVQGKAGLYVSVKTVSRNPSYSPETFLTRIIGLSWYPPDMGHGPIPLADYER